MLVKINVYPLRVAHEDSQQGALVQHLATPLKSKESVSSLQRVRPLQTGAFAVVRCQTPRSVLRSVSRITTAFHVLLRHP